ncbi:hypothetical protein [Microbacterium sp. NPDC080220]|uniref:hypothetical protein n=1 Tax=Microbacterium sp. NPDC080220 TaxID=3161017 RepID=UPI003422708D
MPEHHHPTPGTVWARVEDGFHVGSRDGNTFDDLEAHGDPSATLRAARELSLWFRVRATQPR